MHCDVYCIVEYWIIYRNPYAKDKIRKEAPDDYKDETQWNKLVQDTEQKIIKLIVKQKWTLEIGYAIQKITERESFIKNRYLNRKNK